METVVIEEMITGCIAGDEPAIASFIQEYQAAVYRLALSVLDDPAEANEAAQDTFIAALKALKNYQEKSSFRAWLYRITLNICRSRLRKRRSIWKLKERLGSSLRVQAQKQLSLEEGLIQQEKDSVLWQALNALGEKHKIPLVLRYYHELSTAEIAGILGLNLGTVHSRLSTGRDRLRATLEEQFSRTGE